MLQIAAQELHYLGLGTFLSVCRLQAFDVEDAPNVVIATELQQNPWYIGNERGPGHCGSGVPVA